MHRLLITAAAVSLLALPAAAQQSPSTSPSGGSSGAQMGQSAQPQAATAQKVRQSLQQAGFQDISVVDAAYLVHAQTKDGNFVLMLVDPPGGPAATTGAGGAGSQAQASQQQKLKDSLQKAGFSNVMIVDAAYLVHAKTADGSVVRMTIDPPSMTTGMGAGSQGGSGSMGGGSSAPSSSAPSSPSQQR